MKPINPIKVFSFEEIGDAFRFLGSGKHIGKLIISNGEKEAAKVTVGYASTLLSAKADNIPGPTLKA